VEREETIIRLYVTNIQPGDAGRYTCVRMLDGVIREEKSVSMSLFR